MRGAQVNLVVDPVKAKVALGAGGHQPMPVLLRQREHSQVGAGQVTDLPGDVGQYLAGIGAGQQRHGDFGAGLDPALLAAGRLIQPRVLRRDARRSARRHQHRLVILGEFPAAALVGQVQVAEHLVADPHRHAEEAAHRRVVRREPGRCRVRGDLGQTDRPGIIDQQAEHTTPFRPATELPDLLFAHPDRDELGQLAARADDTQRPVGRVHQASRRLHDPPQRGLQIQALADRDNRFQQARIRSVVATTARSRACSSASSSSSFKPGSSAWWLAAEGSTGEG